MLTRHVFIIGMPGSGKSSLSKRVSGALGLRYVDTDARIAEAVGGSVNEIFAAYGEQAFRNAETNTLIQLTREEPSVISTGGGMIMRDVNREIMRNHGVIVLIDRPLMEILSDIKLDRRPMLAAKGLPEVERLYYERIGIYRAVSDQIVDNSKGYQAGLWALDRILKYYGA